MVGARTIGVVYLLYFVAAVAGAILSKGIVDGADPAASASNIAAHIDLYRAGTTTTLLGNILYIVLVALFYRLFEPVNRSLSLVAAFFGLAGCVLAVLVNVLQLVPTLSTAHGADATALAWHGPREIAFLLALQSQTMNTTLVMFAIYCLLLGYLVFRSGFLPRVLGVLLMAAGAGWLSFLWPPLAVSLASFLQPFGFLAEFVFMLWLLLRGPDSR